MPEVNDVNSQTPESLEVYKTSRWFRLKQKIKWMSPKKKVIYFMLPLLVIVLALGLIFALAVSGDPVMRLTDGMGQEIEDRTMKCGQTYSIRIMTDVNPANHSNQNGFGVITAGSFISYDSSKFSNISIDSSLSHYGIGGDALEFVDDGAGLIQVVRASSSPLNEDNRLLAILNVTVAPSASGSTQMRFFGNQSGDASEQTSGFGMEETGIVLGVDYSVDGSGGNYDITLSCDGGGGGGGEEGCSGELCNSVETCNNWEDETTRCCAVACEPPVVCTGDVCAQNELCPVNTWLDEATRCCGQTCFVCSVDNICDQNELCPENNWMDEINECCEEACLTCASEKICSQDEMCPGSMWLSEIHRCCTRDCFTPPPGTAALLLSPSRVTVNAGTTLPIELILNNNNSNVTDIDVVLDYTNSHWSMSDNRLDVNSSIANSVAEESAGSGKVTIKLRGYTGGTGEVKLADMDFGAKFVEIDSTKITFENGTQIKSGNDVVLISSKGEGIYKIIKKEIVIDGQVNITVSETAATAGFSTNLDAICRLNVVGGQVAPSIDSSASTVHSYKVIGLTSGQAYNYTIICNGASGSGLTSLTPPVSGEFTAVQIDKLEIYDHIVPKSKIKANSAVVSWWTRKGINKNGLSNTVVYYRPSGGEYAEIKKAELVSGHEVKLTGLLDDTDYRVVISSHTTKETLNRTAGGGCSSSATCDFKVLTFTTDDELSSPDSNIILRVDPDRTCDTWLYCNAYVEVPRQNTEIFQVGQKPGNEEVCFSVGLCDELDEAGGCAHSVDSSTNELTRQHPGDAESIANLSGYSKAGLDWGYRCSNTGSICGYCGGVISHGACTSNRDCRLETCQSVKSVCGEGQCVEAKIRGNYPYSSMTEAGVPVNIANFNFEDGTTRPWSAYNNIDKYILNVIDERNTSNRVLQVDLDKDQPFPGVVLTGLAKEVKAGKDYIISFRARTDNWDGQDIIVELAPDRDGGTGGYIPFTYYDFNEIDPLVSPVKKKVRLEPYWQEFIMRVNGPVDYGGSSNLNKLNVAFVSGDIKANMDTFYLDNVSMKGALQIGDDLNFISRSCRLYPRENAPACDYYDEDEGKDYKGWKGYCVEPDPGWTDRQYTSQPMCLQWWPVDVVRGESNVFGVDDVAGYTGRKPLYYCLEAAGNYKRENVDLGACSPQMTCGGNKTREVCNTKSGCEWVSRRESDNNILETEDRQSYISPYESGEYRVTYEYPVTIMDRNVGEASYIFWNFDGSRLNRSEILGVRLHTNGSGSQWNLSGSLLNAKSDGPLGMNETAPRGGESNKMGYTGYFWEGNTWVFQYNEGEREGEDIFSDTYLDCGNDNDGKIGNFLGMKLSFYEDTGDLYEIYFKECDDPSDSGDGTDKATLSLTFYLSEPCLKIAQVVDLDGFNAAWLKRLNSGNVDDPSWVGYTKGDDYMLFGSIIPPDPVEDPSIWTSAIYVEPADKTMGEVSPYQPRAGGAYGLIRGNCVTSVCEKYSLSNPPPEFFGPATCVSGSKIGQPCRNGREDCELDIVTGKYGLCVGISASQVYFNDISEDDEFDKLNSLVVGQGGNDLINTDLVLRPMNLSKGEYNLSKIFAKSFDVWEWKFDNTSGIHRYRYVKMNNRDNYDLTDYYGSPPQVKNILINNSNFLDRTIFIEGTAVLKFDSFVNPNQIPLVRYTVDWGDDEKSTEAGLRIAGRDMSNPHILVHHYKYDASDPACDDTLGKCEFNIRIQLEDNWGQGRDEWHEPLMRVVVYKEKRAIENPPILSLDQSELVFTAINDGAVDDNDQIINISNNGEGVLVWSVREDVAWMTIDPMGGKDDEPIVVTVAGISGMSVGNHSGELRILSNGGTATIPVTLVIRAANQPPVILPVIPDNGLVIQDFVASPILGVAPLTVNFDADVFVSVGEYPMLVFLDFGDNDSYETTIADDIDSHILRTHSYPLAGIYFASLTITDHGGNELTSDEIEIVVR